MDTVVFIIRKENNSFVSYQIIKGKSPEQAADALANFNKRESNNDRAEIVTDQHVIDAILRKESIDTVKSYAEDFQDTIRSFRNEVDDLFGRMAQNIENVLDYIKEKHAPQDNAEDSETASNTASTKAG